MAANTAMCVKEATGSTALEKRLRLHRRLHPVVAWLNGPGLILNGIMAAGAIIMLFFENRHSPSLLPFSGIALYMAIAYVFLALLIIWQKNIVRIAASGDVAAVGPLLDFAEATFLDRSSNKPKPKSTAIVLNSLPDLLARMSAGDGPTLTPRQREILRRLTASPLYRPSFDQPGLEAKINAMLEK